MLAHLRGLLVDLSVLGITLAVFQVGKPCPEEVGAQAYDNLGILELVRRNGFFAIARLVGQQYAAVTIGIVLYMTAAGIFC